jgi:hypothetical protein
VSDWDFLHEMNDRGYSTEDIADAAACGYPSYPRGKQLVHLWPDWHRYWPMPGCKWCFVRRGRNWRLRKKTALECAY